MAINVIVAFFIAPGAFIQWLVVFPVNAYCNPVIKNKAFALPIGVREFLPKLQNAAFKLVNIFKPVFFQKGSCFLAPYSSSAVSYNLFIF